MKLTLTTLLKKKQTREPIVMVTAYDATLARLIDDAGADILLVGDSLGMVIQGHETTLPVTLEDMIYHTRAVARAARRAIVVADMPFLSYQVSLEDAIRNAGQLMKVAGAEAVKLEGGRGIAKTVAALSNIGIPVIGHVGLEPQRVHAYGGYKLQGTTADTADRIFDDAQAVAEAGAVAIVLEGIPAALAARITEVLPIPTIGIGSGPRCDGQVLVSYDLWGFNPQFKPKFVKRYCDGHSLLSEAVKTFAAEVRSNTFPSKDYTPK